MLTFEYLGAPLTYQKIVPGNVVSSIDTDTHTIMGTHKAYFYSGGTATLAPGNKITGNSSASTATVTGVVLETGTFGAGTAAGWVYVISPSAAFTAAEAILVATVDGGNLVADFVKIPSVIGQTAKAALILVSAQTSLVTLDGHDPDQTYLIGIPIVSGASLLVTDPNAIRNIKVIDAVSGSASTVRIVCFF